MRKTVILLSLSALFLLTCATARAQHFDPILCKTLDGSGNAIAATSSALNVFLSDIAGGVVAVNFDGVLEAN